LYSALEVSLLLFDSQRDGEKRSGDILEGRVIRGKFSDEWKRVSPEGGIKKV
jgi:hypothetical protein